MKKRRSGWTGHLFILRQVNAKAAAFSKCALDGNMTAMRLGDVFDNCQAQTGTPFFATAGFVHAVEALEKPWQMFLSNTAAVILDTDNHLGILLVKFQQNGAMRHAVFKGIIQQIHHRLFDQSGVN